MPYDKPSHGKVKKYRTVMRFNIWDVYERTRSDNSSKRVHGKNAD